MNIGDLVTTEEIEREHIRLVMEKLPLDKAATTLGIDPATLYRKRKKWGMPINTRNNLETTSAS